MRKKRMLLIILLSVAVMFAGVHQYVSTQSEFEIGTSSGMLRTAMEEHGTVYFGFQLYFHGYGTPTIENVSVVHEDGTVNQPNSKQIVITPFVDKSGSVGVLPEGYVAKEGMTNEIIPIQGFKFTKKHHNVAFKVELKDPRFDQDFNTLIVEYRHLGRLKTQSLNFDGFFSNQTAKLDVQRPE